MLNAIYEAVIQFLFPPRCPSCRAYVEKEGQWCESCLSEILRNKNLAYDAEVRGYISPIVAIGKYDKGLKDLIHELKYQNDFAALPYIYTVLDRLDDEWQQFFADFDYVIPVPLHAEKLKRRGFNQVDRIFLPWAKAHGLHYADILIARRNKIAVQSQSIGAQYKSARRLCSEERYFRRQCQMSATRRYLHYGKHAEKLRPRIKRARCA